MSEIKKEKKRGSQLLTVRKSGEKQGENKMNKGGGKIGKK